MKRWLRLYDTTPETSVLSLIDADFVTLKHLKLTDGKQGLTIFDGSTDFVGESLNLTGNFENGLWADGGSSLRHLKAMSATNNGQRGVLVMGQVGSITDSTFSDNGSGGLVVLGQVELITNNVFSNNGTEGLSVSSSRDTVIEANIAERNRGYGMSVAASSGATVTLGNARSFALTRQSSSRQRLWRDLGLLRERGWQHRLRESRGDWHHDPGRNGGQQCRLFP